MLYDKDGNVISEMRSDGTRAINFFDLARIDSSRVQAPNAHRFAMVYNDALVALRRFELPLESIDTLLRQPKLQVLSHEPSSASSGAERYKVKLGGVIRHITVVDVDSKSHRI